MKLIAFVGFISSGKDTACGLLENYGFKSFSFAESLKDSIASIFCWDRALLEGDTPESRIWRESEDTWWANKLEIPNLTPRWVMQNVGTNVFRKHFHPDIWIHNIERKLTLLDPDTKVVIKDSRFPNELSLARKFNGKIVRIKRGPDPRWFDIAVLANLSDLQSTKDVHRTRLEKNFKVHESEWAWVGYPIDFTINNDSTIMNLHEEVARICL